MLHILKWEPNAKSAHPVAVSDLPRTVCDVAPGSTIWIDLENPTSEEESRILAEFLPIHPLSLEDISKPRRNPSEGAHLPKVEEFLDYLLVIVNPLPPWVKETVAKGSLMPTRRDTRRLRPQLSAVLTRRVLITHHYDSLHCISNVLGYVARHTECGERGPDYLFHLILDDMVDEYAPVVEQVADELDTLEDKLFLRPSPRLLRRLLRLKRRVTLLRKTLVLEREVLARLIRGEFALVEAQEMVFYRNVYDHVVRYAELIESGREMVSDLMQSHLAAVSNRLNEIMKTLTMFSIIGVVCTLIAGIYGMNFEHMPELKWTYGYPFALGLMVTAVLVCIGIFRWRRWL